MAMKKLFIFFLLASTVSFVGCAKKAEAPIETPAAAASDSLLPPPPPPTNNDSMLATVDHVLESLGKANIAFNVPEKLNIKQTAQIELLLSPGESVEQLRNAIKATGGREGATIRISNRMEARLTGAAFQITAITPEEQAVGSIERVNWKWDVTPTTSGQHPLHLTLSALVLVDGNTTRRAIQTFDKTIIVNVTPTQLVENFVKNNWQWLWATILLPIAGGIWKRRKSKNDGLA